MDWFLYDNGVSLERVRAFHKTFSGTTELIFILVQLSEMHWAGRVKFYISGLFIFHIELF